MKLLAHDLTLRATSAARRFLEPLSQRLVDTDGDCMTHLPKVYSMSESWSSDRGREVPSPNVQAKAPLVFTSHRVLTRLSIAIDFEDYRAKP